jgi:hypothetical protein
LSVPFLWSTLRNQRAMSALQRSHGCDRSRLEEATNASAASQPLARPGRHDAEDSVRLYRMMRAVDRYERQLAREQLRRVRRASLALGDDCAAVERG